MKKTKKKTGKKTEKKYPRYFIPNRDTKNRIILAKVESPGAEIFYIWDDNDCPYHHSHPTESDAEEYVKRGKWIEIPLHEAVLIQK